MRFLAAAALTSALACASTSSASSPGQMASAQGQACPASQVAAVVAPSSELYARPDGNSKLMGNVDGGTKVCVDTSTSGYGFRRIKLPDGSEGYVDETHVNLL